MQSDMIIVNLSILLLVLEQHSVWKFSRYFQNMKFYDEKTKYP